MDDIAIIVTVLIALSFASWTDWQIIPLLNDNGVCQKIGYDESDTRYSNETHISCCQYVDVASSYEMDVGRKVQCDIIQR